MERSERGIFSLNLRLYPGRYEVTVSLSPSHQYFYRL
jgi:hypothetical protein